MEEKLTAEVRRDTGKGVARKLRASGRVPGILYGHRMEPVALTVDSRSLYHVLHTGAGSNVLVDLVIDGKTHLAMPREIQQNHIKGQLVHVDFLAVNRNETIAIDVPIREVGEAPGVKAGGVIEHHLFELHVECLPRDVPEAIDVDVTRLELGDALRVADIEAPDGVTILSNPEDSVLAVVVPAVLRTEAELETPEEAAAAAAAPAAPAEAEAAPPAEGEAPADESAPSGEGGGEG
jgi:large subunit ribosomal protein L25